MSTSSKYSSNKLKEVLENGTKHFITKSFVSAVFDYDYHSSEYHLYWHNENKSVFEDMNSYKQMSFKQLNNREKKYFKEIQEDYIKVVENRYGSVWENKKLGFDKTLVLIKHLSLF